MCYLFLKDYYAEIEGMKRIIRYCSHALCELLYSFVPKWNERNERNKKDNDGICSDITLEHIYS